MFQQPGGPGVGECHFHPIGAGFFIRGGLIAADAVLAQQIFSQAEVHPATWSRGWGETVAQLGFFHQALAGSAGGTDCHNRLVLTGGESQHFVQAASTQCRQVQWLLRAGMRMA
jgi:hypothetical protein